MASVRAQTLSDMIYNALRNNDFDGKFEESVAALVDEINEKLPAKAGKYTVNDIYTKLSLKRAPAKSAKGIPADKHDDTMCEFEYKTGLLCISAKEPGENKCKTHLRQEKAQATKEAKARGEIVEKPKKASTKGAPKGKKETSFPETRPLSGTENGTVKTNGLSSRAKPPAPVVEEPTEEEDDPISGRFEPIEGVENYLIDKEYGFVIHKNSETGNKVLMAKISALDLDKLKKGTIKLTSTILDGEVKRDDLAVIHDDEVKLIAAGSKTAVMTNLKNQIDAYNKRQEEEVDEETTTVRGTTAPTRKTGK